MNKAVAALALACLAVAGCGAPPAEPPLAGAALGGPFSLVDQDGRRRTDADFAGRYRLVYFGYTYCPDVCPVDLQKLMQGVGRLRASAPAKAARLAPIFISVDPARDTPAVLKRYVAAFGAGLTGLTGTDAEIAAVARRYGVTYQRERPVAGQAADAYLMGHSRTSILYDPAGKPLALIPQEGTPQEIEAELARWMT